MVKNEADGFLTFVLTTGGVAVVPLAEVESRKLEPLSPMPVGLVDHLATRPSSPT